MALTQKDYGNFIETVLSVFTVDDSKIKVLLVKKNTEPYKGYWILPSNNLKNTETLENNITDVAYDITGFSKISIEQCDIFSELKRDPDNRLIAVSYVGLVDSKTAELKRERQEEYETEWFDVDNIPKMAYDHNVIIQKSVDYIKERLIKLSILKVFFPSDFTLPEIQKLYELIFEINIDRRNFRKKFLTLDIIEETTHYSDGMTGRPAKLYRFKENTKDINLF